MQILMRNLFHNYFLKSILTSYTEVVPNRKVRDFFFPIGFIFFTKLFSPSKNLQNLKTPMKWEEKEVLNPKGEGHCTILTYIFHLKSLIFHKKILLLKKV